MTIIFGFFAAFADSLLTFFLPAIFYIKSCYLVDKKYDKIMLIVAIIYIVLGIATFIFSNYNTIRKFYN